MNIVSEAGIERKGRESPIITGFNKFRRLLFLEQADALRHILGHTELEHEYFLVLVEHQRAGTENLKRRFQQKLDDLTAQWSHLTSRVQGHDSLAEEHHERYYRTWHAAAIHILLTIPDYQTADAIARRLHLDESFVSETLQFLVGCGLAKEAQGSYGPTTSQLHLSNTGKLAAQQNLSWRMQALPIVERNLPQHVHYSSAMTLSQADVSRVKEAIFKCLNDIKGIVSPSPAEDLYALTLDWFRL